MPTREAAITPADVAYELNERYGLLLKERREALALSQAQLGQLADVHRGTIRNAELGKPMELRTHSNVLRALGCAPNVRNWDDRENPHLDEVLSARVAGLAAKAALAYPEDVQTSILHDYFELISELAKGRMQRDQLRVCFELAGQMRPKDQELFDTEIATIAGDEYPVRWFDGERQVVETQLTGPIRPATIQGKASIALPSIQAEARGLAAATGASLSNLISEALAGEPGMAQLVLEGLSGGVPQEVIARIIQAGMPDEDRQKLMRHAAKRAAEVRLALIAEMALIIDLTDR